MNTSSHDFLHTNAQTMGVVLDATQVDVLLRYAELIAKWNKTYNLTAISNPRDILIHHILDSLSIIPFLDEVQSQDILDIGAGAGLPSVVIAILTHHRVMSVDKVAKKCTFMQFVKAQLGLSNLIVTHSRVEDIHMTFDVITSRAFSSITNTLELSSKLLKKNGKYLLLKGNNWQQEESIDGKILAHKVSVPHLSTQRFILEISP